ncbi:uncharacterized protein LOC108742242 [Agrilus planipennis]|uniref:Uncharacterized protein LOC108742242 n=1 Tax=Agrilus planipennis TaxID=224129 RepID=A0A1W4XJB5_AGRPL|nr:uncharacterized protein LOC108742242 [Agrilus planipennis]
MSFLQKMVHMVQWFLKLLAEVYLGGTVLTGLNPRRDLPHQDLKNMVSNILYPCSCRSPCTHLCDDTKKENENTVRFSCPVPNCLFLSKTKENIQQHLLQKHVDFCLKESFRQKKPKNLWEVDNKKKI